MQNKIPKSMLLKWRRYTKIEKVFIFYCLILFFCIIFLPIVKISNFASNNENLEYIYFYSNNLIFSKFLILILLLFLIGYNISFRFKNYFNYLVGFKDNNSLLNFIVILIISIFYLTLFETIYFINESLTISIEVPNFVSIVIGILFIFGLMWNILMGLNISKNKKKSNIINIVPNKSSFQKEEEEGNSKTIKSLFE